LTVLFNRTADLDGFLLPVGSLFPSEFNIINALYLEMTVVFPRHDSCNTPGV
jgi:predicted outer membrane lipoprotein